MTDKQRSARIVVIERQEYWREFALEGLRSAGYRIDALENYHDAYAMLEDSTSPRADLVILGCTGIDVKGGDECKLATRILECEWHLLLFSATLSSSVMRALFLKGVEDVVEKVYDSRSLLTIVEQTLQRIAERAYFHFPVESRG